MVPILRNQDVAVQLGRLGRGAGFRELHRGFGFGVRFVRDRLQLRFRRQPVFQDGAAPEQDRVPRLRRLDFLLGAIALRVAHRVAAEAVRHRLDQLGPAAGTRPFGHFAHGVPHGEDVVPVDLHRRDVEHARFLIDGADSGHALEGRSHSVSIVFDDRDQRQSPHRGHVEAGIERADVGRSLPEEAGDDPRQVPILNRQRHAGRQRDVPADDGVAAPEMVLDVRHVHRTALAFRKAGRLAVQFRHHPFRVDAARQDVTVVAVMRDHVVVRPEGGHRADRDGLFPDVEVQESADLALAVCLFRALLEPADQAHLLEPVEGFRLGDRQWNRILSEWISYFMMPVSPFFFGKRFLVRTKK